MADDPAVSLVALAVDLVEEYDGDRSYIEAALDVDPTCRWSCWRTSLSAIDHEAAADVARQRRPRSRRHVERVGRDRSRPALGLGPPDAHPGGGRRAAGAVANSPCGRKPLRPDESFALLADYGIPVAAMRQVDSADAAVVAAHEIGYPVVMKTAAALAHKSDVGGVVLGVADDDRCVRTMRGWPTRTAPR